MKGKLHSIHFFADFEEAKEFICDRLDEDAYRVHLPVEIYKIFLVALTHK
jgi:hypothetical protein